MFQRISKKWELVFTRFTVQRKKLRVRVFSVDRHLGFVRKHNSTKRSFPAPLEKYDTLQPNNRKGAGEKRMISNQQLDILTKIPWVDYSTRSSFPV